MTTPACDALLAHFSDYLDGEAPPELCAALEQHLATCDTCHAVVDTLRKTVTLYHELPQPDFPADARTRLFHRLDLDDFLASS
jgi:anti-sigma factor RsiW